MIIRPPDWQYRAACAEADPEAWFPEKGGSAREAKQVCMACDVSADCLEYALTNDIRHGVWGGLSFGQRRRLEQQRGRT